MRGCGRPYPYPGRPKRGQQVAYHMKLRVRVLCRIAILAAIAFGGAAGMGAVSIATSNAAAAQAVVAAVVVQGNRRVDTEAILGYVGIKAGGRADPLKIDEALKTL